MVVAGKGKGEDMLTSLYKERLQRVQHAAHKAGISYAFFSISPDLYYLTGYSSFISERLLLLVVPVEGRPTMVVPEFEKEMVVHLAEWIDIVGWLETESPTHLVRDSLAPKDRDAPLRIAIGDHTRAIFLLRLQAALPRAQFVSASSIMTPLRRVKDAHELQTLKEAQAMAVEALQQLLGQAMAGRTEKQVATALRRACEEVGFEGIEGILVGSGPNGAVPHLAPTDRVVRRGEPVVLDFGAVHRGYYSDCTRTVHVGPPSNEFVQVFEIVRKANEMALAAIRPGVTCERIDGAARQVIDEAGYGQFFTHRLGHGLGLEIHEEPYMLAGNDLALEPGMTFTDEPGIYLSGRFGCRLEDVVAVTQHGGIALTDYTHELIVVE